MEEKSRFAVGLDIGTGSIRAVVGSIGRDGHVSVVGYNEASSGGMRKGIVVDLTGPASAIDVALKPVEDMSGVQVDAATVSVNGVHILSTKAEGMIAVGTTEHEIDESDLDRVDAMAITGKVPANRETLDLVPHDYILDGQGGIKDPLGMRGSRLEVRANVISGLVPYCENVRKAAEMAKVSTQRLVPSVVAAARAVLTEHQMENGVGVIDIGAATTGVAVFDEGDLQYVGVVPKGSNNITNDLAMVLKAEPEIAEEIKCRFVTGVFGVSDKDIVIKKGRDELKFSRAEVDETAEARLDEIFGEVRKELKKAGYDRKLPEGVVLTGGGAKLRDIEIYAKEKMELAARIGVPPELGSLGEAVAKPEYATALGLMLIGARSGEAMAQKKSDKKTKKSGGLIKKLFNMFK
ncbi:cell division protein FtsA [Candidatus Saccharibacteria bacterium]|nr:cell division protein FtsA [Candidatus Saccharibacteria bacterium]